LIKPFYIKSTLHYSTINQILRDVNKLHRILYLNIFDYSMSCALECPLAHPV